MGWMDAIRLSEYGRASATPSPVNQMMAAFGADFRPGVDVNLGVGYVSEEAIPHEHIQDGYNHVLDHPAQYRGSLNYGPPAGEPVLIEAIRRTYARRLNDRAVAQKRIVIGSSGASSLLDATAAVLSPGIVVTSDPVYYIFTDFLERLGFELLAVPEDKDGIDIDLLEHKLDRLGSRADQISFFYLVTVSNPTCTVLSNARRRRLTELVASLSQRLGRKIPLLFDTAYEPLVHDPAIDPLESALADDPLGIVHEIGSVSKILAPALRIGYIIGPNSPFMAALVQKGSDNALGPPPLNQQVASYLLDDERMVQQRAAANAAYREKATHARAWIEKHLGHAVTEIRGGSAGFYFYLTLRDTPTHGRSPFFGYLTRTTGDPQVDGPADDLGPRVVVVPGEYCVHRDGDLVNVAQKQLRLSYGYEGLTQIEKAIKLMAQAVEYGRR